MRIWLFPHAASNWQPVLQRVRVVCAHKSASVANKKHNVNGKLTVDMMAERPLPFMHLAALLPCKVIAEYIIADGEKNHDHIYTISKDRESGFQNSVTHGHCTHVPTHAPVTHPRLQTCRFCFTDRIAAEPRGGRVLGEFYKRHSLLCRPHRFFPLTVTISQTVAFCPLGGHQGALKHRTHAYDMLSTT